MFAYYLDLALRSFRRNRVLTALMVLAIGLGIGAAMTTLTVFHVLSGDPLPGRSQAIYMPQMDPQSKDGYHPGDKPSEQFTRLDAEALLRADKADRQAVMTGGNVGIQSSSTALKPFSVDARYTSADFFPMFNVPFVDGAAWTRTEDDAQARVAVIARKLAEKVFGSTKVTGRTLRIEGHDVRIVGVLDTWNAVPKFYDGSTTDHGYGDTEQVFVPFSTSRALTLPRSGNMNCYADTPDGLTSVDVGAPCMWTQFWVQLDTPAKARDYEAFLHNYVAQQRASGRFERPDTARLIGLMPWLVEQEVVPNDVRLQVWLAIGFLLVCLLNTVGLLLAKFMRRAPEIGVRRALGASRGAIFGQCLTEAGVIGIAGGVLGLGLALLGLWAVRHQPTGYASFAHLDLPMLATTFVLALVASLAAGALPAWRACLVPPALQLKSQ